MSQQRYKQQRQAATPKGFLRRLGDARLEAVDDPRQNGKVKHPMGVVLRVAVLALVSGARSTRAVESRSESLKADIRRQTNHTEQQIADNTFGLLLRRIDWLNLRCRLHAYIKEEWARGRLRPERLPQSTVAIDGKHLATIPEKRLRGLITNETLLDGNDLDFDELKRVYSTQFPYVQVKQKKDGTIYGAVRVHRATLISSNAAVVLDQWPIRHETNEWGTIEATLNALWRDYRHTDILEMVTLDSGNATPEAASWLREPRRQIDYFMAVKQPQGSLKAIALERLAGRTTGQADCRVTTRQQGKDIEYVVWSCTLEEKTQFQDARQLFRIERTVGSGSDATTGTRYFVTSQAADELEADDARRLARAHWRCENEGHWTADAIWDEDARRTPWTQHPDGLVVVGLLRAIAINILAVLRALSRIKHRQGQKMVTPSWKTVIEYAYQVLFDHPCLNTGGFHDFE